MKFYCLTHVDFEGPANIETWALANGHEFVTARAYQNEFLAEDYDVLVSMGGPMSANDGDKFSWLNEERKVMERAIAGGKKVIGVCLGAQIAARTLGASVYQNPEKEIGWFDLSSTGEGRRHPLLKNLPEVFPVFHWHGETFDLPDGAVHLFESEGCLRQGFLYDNRVLGFQFHMEGTQESLISMMEHSRDEMTPGKYVQSETEIREKTAQYISQTTLYFNEIMSRFLEL